MNERQADLFWARAEQWVATIAFGRLRKVQALCPMCGILAVSGAFIVHGQRLALCQECAQEAKAGKRRRIEE